MDSWVGFIEFFVVTLFALAWAILEWLGRHLDRKREENAKKSVKDLRSSQ